MPVERRASGKKTGAVVVVARQKFSRLRFCLLSIVNTTKLSALQNSESTASDISLSAETRLMFGARRYIESRNLLNTGERSFLQGFNIGMAAYTCHPRV
jgi:hypothetical protein